MSRMRNAGNRAFFVEFFLSLVVLTICGLVCAATFVRANSLSVDSREQTLSLNCLQSAMERAKAEAARNVPNGHIGHMEEKQLAWFNEDWEPAAQEGARYAVETEYSLSADGMLTIRLTARQGERVVETLEGKKYLPEQDSRLPGEVQP